MHIEGGCMSKRIKIGSGAPWEDIVGYSRVVRVGNVIEVSGTVSVENNEVVGPNDPYAQTKHILEKIGASLRRVGADIKHVVRTRMFVTDISNWEKIGKAHGEVFKDIKPVTSMVEIRSLISKEFLVEIEATAIL
jgi:enamine deaminase RidA (YjgF/YER057c/UK114 family)